MAKPINKKAAKKSLGAFVHGDKRRNIPTAEMQGLVGDDDAKPVRVEYQRKKAPAHLYHRNADYDPQLVWNGKDEEDGKPLVIDAVPIYVQEKISPQAIIEDLRRHSAAGGDDDIARRLFGDFNGIAEDARVEFYKHAQNWTNRMILGDSLQVMASLGHKENLRGKVQCFYMDPPYGIKYSSNWQPSTKNTAVKDSDDSGEPEVVRAFRDTWKDGVHSYLSYLRDRLRAAKDLLTESGSAFVQIGDENVHLTRCVMDEVFGRENFVSMITFTKTSPLGSKLLAGNCDYIIWYANNKENMKYKPVFVNKDVGAESSYKHLMLEDGTKRPMTAEELSGDSPIPKGADYFTQDKLMSTGYTQTCYYDFEYNGRTIKPAEKSWRTTQRGMLRLVKSGRVYGDGIRPGYVQKFMDFPAKTINNIWGGIGGASNMVYVVQTNEKVIQRCILMTTDPGDLVFDPTCGSGTTAVVAEQWGRRWITCDTSRVSLALARARMMAKSHDYYLLADSKAGAQKEAEISGKPSPKQTFANDIRQGFVCRRVPHITLGDIAKNQNIDEIWQLWQEKLQPLLQTINKETGGSYEEWQLPADEDENWNPAAKTAHREFMTARAKRQQQINQSINKNARSEKLHDAPFADNKMVRVSGPFTVESLSPFRMIPTNDKSGITNNRPRAETENETRFLDIVFQNLKAAGVQTNKKEGHIKFDDLLPCPRGERVQYEGTYSANGKTHRAAICIGPEYGTVGFDLLTLAAAEARHLRVDILIVLGFAFEAHADAEIKNLGNIRILRARMNADLQMANRLQTGKDTRDNLFVVFGEPDIDIRKTKDGQLQAEIRGLDIYNPATGEVKSSGADDIYCWFIDTDYNEQSFFVRHAYFCGGGKNPHKKHINKLKTDLRAEINEDAWNTMYSTTSRPFPPPATGKIAIKAINHYGDEVIKIFTTAAG